MNELLYVYDIFTDICTEQELKEALLKACNMEDVHRLEYALTLWQIKHGKEKTL